MPSMSGWANSRTRGVAGQNSQNSSMLLGRATAMQIAPEMKLNRRLPGDAPFSHTSLFRAQISDMTLAISIAARAASVPRLIFVLEATFARLRFGFHTENGVDHGNAVIRARSAATRRSRSGRDVRRDSVLPLQDDAEGDDGVRFFLQRDFANDDRNFKGARNLMERDGAPSEQRSAIRRWHDRPGPGRNAALNWLATIDEMCALPIDDADCSGDLAAERLRANCSLGDPRRFRADVPSSPSWSRGISRCADWLRCESAPVRPSECRSPRARRLSSDCW